VARPETGHEPVGTLRAAMTSTGAEAASRDPVRRDPARSERTDRTERTDRDRAERRERREPGLLRDLGRSDRSPVRRDSRRDSQRLDVPREKRRLIRRPRFEDDAFGRFAEQFARFMGTARFLLYMTAFVAAWLLYNWLAPSRFDPFPFIFLTLMLSLQASYAAPLILLAQNRQEDRDRVIGERDRMANTRAHADMEFLAREMASVRMALGEVATRDFVRSELRALLQELEDDAERPDQRPDQRPEQRHEQRHDQRLDQPKEPDEPRS
jgi:uncharacterized membrane protein